LVHLDIKQTTCVDKLQLSRTALAVWKNNRGKPELMTEAGCWQREHTAIYKQKGSPHDMPKLYIQLHS